MERTPAGTARICGTCGGDITGSKFCTRCGASGTANAPEVLQRRSAAERLGVSSTPPRSTTAPTQPLFQPAVPAESASSWASSSFSAANTKSKPTPVWKLLATVVIAVVAFGGGLKLAMGKHVSSLTPGDCVALDQPPEAHTVPCDQTHIGHVISKVTDASQCAGIAPYWIRHKGQTYCVSNDPA